MTLSLIQPREMLTRGCLNPGIRNYCKALLEIVNNFSRFNSHIANMTLNLRSLLKKDSDFILTDIHLVDFKTLIEALCREGKN